MQCRVAGHLKGSSSLKYEWWCSALLGGARTTYILVPELRASQIPINAWLRTHMHVTNKSGSICIHMYVTNKSYGSRFVCHIHLCHLYTYGLGFVSHIHMCTYGSGFVNHGGLQADYYREVWRAQNWIGGMDSWGGSPPQTPPISRPEGLPIVLLIGDW